MRTGGGHCINWIGAIYKLSISLMNNDYVHISGITLEFHINLIKERVTST